MISTGWGTWIKAILHVGFGNNTACHPALSDGHRKTSRPPAAVGPAI
jgi:hypothetical protein